MTRHKKRNAFLILVVLIFIMTIELPHVAFAESKDRALHSGPNEETITDNTSDSTSIQNDLIELLSDALTCNGTYVIKGSRKDYIAKANFYMNNNQLYASISYSGFGGDIQDAMVLHSQDPNYLLYTEPEGTFWDDIQYFKIWIGKNSMRITWADGDIDYVLQKADDDYVPDVRSAAERFPETEEYANLLELIKQNFSNADYTVQFDPKTRTLTTYFAIGNGLREAVLQNENGIQNLIDSLIQTCTKLNGTLSAVVHLMSREGLNDFQTGHSRIIMVDHLQSDHIYDQDHDIIFDLLDDSVEYYVGEAASTFQSR